VQRAIQNWSTIQAAAGTNSIDPNLLAAIALRESDFRNIPQYRKGKGRGVFQIDLRARPDVTAAQAFNIGYAANYAAGFIGV
jgi:hypothetical protein